MKSFIGIMATVCCVLPSLVTGATGVPGSIYYQGQLEDADGNPAPDGFHLVRFVMYDAETGGNELWDSQYQEIETHNGTFNIALGAPPMPSFPDGLFSSDSTRYLSVHVGTDPEITPRTRLISTPYAFHATRSDSALFAESVPDNSISSEKLAPDAVGSPQVQDNALSAVDFVDEPGLASGFTQTAVALPLSENTLLDSAVIVCPSDGYVVVYACCTWRPEHIYGTRDLARFYISPSAGSPDPSTVQIASVAAVDETDADRFLPIAQHTVFSVAAGTYRYYYIGNAFSGSGSVDHIRITAMFFPTGYGTVEANPVSGE